jgi:SAM-dependent methyltransferase
MNEDGKLGRPSYVWRFGQERRLSLVRQNIKLENARIIDIGCGVGMYMQAFLRYSSHVFGTEIEFSRALESLKITRNVGVAPAEYLPFADNSFDMAFLHEMIEHVTNDYLTIKEAYRTVRPGGHIVIFAPNRLYPFETHGIYLGQRYFFGNIPLINYLPNSIRNKFAHHVRAYTTRDIKKLFNGLKVRFVVFTQVYPGFDKIEARFGKVGLLLRKLLYSLETTPLRIFGLSHFVVAEVQK